MGPSEGHLTVAEGNALYSDVVLTIVHRTPAGPAQWRRRCRPVLTVPTPLRRASVSRLVVWARTRGGAQVPTDFSDEVTVRRVVRGVAEAIDTCAAHVPVPAEWHRIAGVLRAAAS